MYYFGLSINGVSSEALPATVSDLFHYLFPGEMQCAKTGLSHREAETSHMIHDFFDFFLKKKLASSPPGIILGWHVAYMDNG